MSDSPDVPYKPTYSSKTDIPCDCGWFQRVIADTNSVIEFDEVFNEYHLVKKYADGGQTVWMMYHCPFCGGTAPQSKRDQFFLQPSPEELDRLRESTYPLTSVVKILEKLDAPEYDYAVSKAAREQHRLRGIEEEFRHNDLSRGVLKYTLRVIFLWLQAKLRLGIDWENDYSRTLTYTNLSETADVHFYIYDSGVVRVKIDGKYIGPSRSHES